MSGRTTKIKVKKSPKTIKIKIVKKKRVGRPCASKKKTEKKCDKKVAKLKKEVKMLRAKVADGGFLKMKMKNDAVKAKAMARVEGKKKAVKKTQNATLKKEIISEKNKRRLDASVKKIKAQQERVSKSKRNASTAEQRYKSMLVNQSDASAFFKERRRQASGKTSFNTSTYTFSDIAGGRRRAAGI